MSLFNFPPAVVATVIVTIFSVLVVALVMIYALNRGFDGIMVASGTYAIGGMCGWVAKKFHGGSKV